MCNFVSSDTRADEGWNVTFSSKNGMTFSPTVSNICAAFLIRSMSEITGICLPSSSEIVIAESISPSSDCGILKIKVNMKVT